MSSKTEPKDRAPLLLFLLGALAFSLSTLPNPEKKHDTFMVTSLSSEFASTCADMVSTLDGGAQGGNCVIKAVSKGTDLANVEGIVSVNLKKNPHHDPNDFNAPLVDSQDWEYTVKILCNGKNCPVGIGNTITVPGHVGANDFRTITAKVLEDFHTGATEMADRIKDAKAAALKEKKRLAQIEKCEIDEDGEKIEGKKQMSCRVDKLADMDDDKSADYYENNILPNIEHLLGSSNMRDQKSGMALLAQIKSADAGGDFVHDSLVDLAKFGTFNIQATQLKSQLMGMAPGDLNYNSLKATMTAAKFRADSYFHARGDQVGQQDWTMGDNDVDYGSVLTSNLQDFQMQIDQNYKALLDQQRSLLANPGNFQALPGQAPTTIDPRTGRATVTSAAWPPNAQFTATPPASQNTAATAKITANKNSAIPRVGTPVAH